MSKADIIYRDTCREIIDNGFSDENLDVRPRWEDGTPAHTKKKFGVVNRYNLAEEFPLMTLRRTYWKSAIDEMLWIWQKKSNDVPELSSHVWDQWAHAEFDRRLLIVYPRTAQKCETLQPVKVAEIQREYTEDEVRHSNYGDYIVLSKEGKKRTIQFLQTGSIRVVTQPTVALNEVKDWYARTVHGVGYYGDYKAEDIQEYFGKYHRRWVNTWENMIRRCNGQYSGNPKWYENVFVSEEFHCCETFLRWVMSNNEYKSHDMLGVLQLDKDYYGGQCYSPNTCVLLTPQQNTWLTSKKWFIYHEQPYYGMADLARKFKEEGHNCFNPSGTYNSYAVNKLLKAYEATGELIEIPLVNADGSLNRFPIAPKYTILKAYGYQIGKPYIHHTIKNAGSVPLEELGDLTPYPSAYIEYDAEKDVANVWMDQIDGVLWDLRNNRASRRIMTNIYNFQDLHAMGLYPCAYSMTFNVTGDTLNGILNQRSQDMLAANNWNVVQYAALMMMIAKATGLKVGELVHVIADCHIYDRHIPLVEKMIQNPPLTAPKMFLDTDETDFYKITKNDFRVEDYSFHPFDEKIEIAI